MRVLATMSYSSPTERQLIVVTGTTQFRIDIKSTNSSPLKRSALRALAACIRVASSGQIKSDDARRLAASQAPAQFDTETGSQVAS